MKNHRHYLSASLLAGFVFITVSNSALAESEIYATQSGHFSDFGDMMQILLPAGALTGSLVIGDNEGAWQLSKGMLTTGVVTHGLKFGFARLRPDGSSYNSFPSGHTSSAFSGAAYIQHRYGNAWGIPAYGLASLVGASRVWANKHYLDDVMAGASIAVMSSLYWTDPYNLSDLLVTPTLGSDSVGLMVNYIPGRGKKTSNLTSNTYDDWGHNQQDAYRHSYELFIGGASTQHNRVQDGNNTMFDLKSFGREDEPNTYAGARLKWGMDKGQYLSINLTPFESRSTSTLAQDINFGGKHYQAGKEVISAYRLWGVNTDYMFELLPNSDWKLDVGAGISVKQLSIRLDNIKGSNLSEQAQWLFAPSVMTEVGYQFTHKLSANIGLHATASSKISSQELWMSLDYQLSQRWATSLIAGRFNQEIEADRLVNHLSMDYAGFTVRYSF
ncbi:phosphatase PAP2 family protein [Shewanella eurypsychrophilus]|uniref:Phosphatase PAP2 family protein n=1 Tax=Shewanella eurypsychrophilus TaxID=2593656 RepID=A0ABX6V2I7_9GAMM|nr:MULTISPECIES: phosphatase PAP2 family protein [Shewanella]QFU21502.1 phosphatase PAP2 family protein [Shewanella sp. YLB-09]QPG56792.1 phosphatase PAP2 family protein [Shewanella eurypsychrophilus]